MLATYDVTAVCWRLRSYSMLVSCLTHDTTSYPTTLLTSSGGFCNIEHFISNVRERWPLRVARISLDLSTSVFHQPWSIYADLYQYPRTSCLHACLKKRRPWGLPEHACFSFYRGSRWFCHLVTYLYDTRSTQNVVMVYLYSFTYLGLHFIHLFVKLKSQLCINI